MRPPRAVTSFSGGAAGGGAATTTTTNAFDVLPGQSIDIGIKFEGATTTVKVTDLAGNLYIVDSVKSHSNGDLNICHARCASAVGLRSNTVTVTLGASRGFFNVLGVVSEGLDEQSYVRTAEFASTNAPVALPTLPKGGAAFWLLGEYTTLNWSCPSDPTVTVFQRNNTGMGYRVGLGAGTHPGAFSGTATDAVLVYVWGVSPKRSPRSRRFAADIASGVTGTLAVTNQNDTSSASGTTTVTGTLSRTNANDTSSASGTTTVVGTLAKTNNNDTLTASGSPIVSGTLARTNANDTLSAAGSVGNPVSGTISVTNTNDTSSASGTTVVVGIGAPINVNDSSNASGTTTIVGTLARTNTNDTLAASGSSGSDVSGTVNYTNVNDFSSASGTTTVTGTVVKTNNDDNAVASGTTTVIGTVNKTNTNDSISAFGVVGNLGTTNTRLPLTGVGS